MNRRGFLGSILALAAAPAIVRADSLMRIVPRETILLRGDYWIDARGSTSVIEDAWADDAKFYEGLDFEEGSFTPTLTGSTSGPVDARFTRVGKLVTVTMATPAGMYVGLRRNLPDRIAL